MSKTKAELKDQVEELENQITELELQLENTSVEEIPEHGHSKHESKKQRQNRLRSRHVRKELEAMSA